MLIFPLWDYTALYVYTVGCGARANPTTAQRNASAQHVVAIQFSPTRKARTNAFKRTTARVRKRAAMLLYIHTKNAAKRV